MIKILLADDHQLVRDSLRTILNVEDDLEIVAEARDYGELLRLVDETTDVVVTDLSMPGPGIDEAMLDLKERFPELPVLLLSMSDQADLAEMADALGAAGGLNKIYAATELVPAIRATAAWVPLRPGSERGRA